MLFSKNVFTSVNTIIVLLLMAQLFDNTSIPGLKLHLRIEQHCQLTLLLVHWTLVHWSMQCNVSVGMFYQQKIKIKSAWGLHLHQPSYEMSKCLSFGGFWLSGNWCIEILKINIKKQKYKNKHKKNKNIYLLRECTQENTIFKFKK